MAVPILNFPLQSVVDGLISYLQFIFSNDEIIPASYKWDTDDRASKIRISAPFVIDNEKPMSAPFIVVERGRFVFANAVIDNVKTATPNTMETVQKIDYMDGTVNVTCGAGVGAEASNLANFLAINLQADRHGIAGNMPFVRNLRYNDVSPEIPVFKDFEVKRWEVTLTLSVSIQLGWINLLRTPTLWTKASIYAINEEEETFSIQGETTQGVDTLVDASKQFGFDQGDDPQLIEKELDNGYYYIQFDGNDQLYPIDEITDENTLKLLTHDSNDDPIPYSAPATADDVEYKLWWNCIHLRGDIPNNNS